MCAVKPEGVPQLCKADEIGELCVCTVATGTSYYGLTGMTKNTFEVRRLRVHLSSGMLKRRRGRYGIFIIVRLKVVKHWCVKPECCYFFWGKVSNDSSTLSIDVQPFLSFLFPQPEQPCMHVSE